MKKKKVYKDSKDDGLKIHIFTKILYVIIFKVI
jgi:hypothetical protein